MCHEVRRDNQLLVLAELNSYLFVLFLLLKTLTSELQEKTGAPGEKP